MNSAQLLRGFALCISFAALSWMAGPARADDSSADSTPADNGGGSYHPLQLGKTELLPLHSNEAVDGMIALPPGRYRLILDLRRTSADSGEIQANVAICNSAGVVTTPSVLTANAVGIDDRAATILSITKQRKVRLRVSNTITDDVVPLDSYVTLTSASSTDFVPFGFGTDVQELAVGDASGSSGTLDAGNDAFYRVALPAGKWALSLTLSRNGDGEAIGLLGHADVLDSFGLTTSTALIKVDAVDTRTTKQAFVTALKPRTIIVRIENDNTENVEAYNLAISKAEDQ